ncbi:ABC transporter substrate-binding protein [Amycolatopsis sp. EV170708-02-1]|uniref:ABC transporter substrate-binding protein n=1 Tax=Amycolatopsis sp. EV170708-02-1 TaxID=2919322 RepID=UPI001F0CDB5B|nr:ABC transporter substrate-binding protein [Amycolatopsis sp. EV170708-02-1]UMP06764.1 ABC transporter substrate-binding protein [Amycolatopsis sp. EV170708-02-1]
MLTTLVGCTSLDDRSKTAGHNLPERDRIKVAALNTVDFIPLRLAQERGYFKAEGLEVDVVDVDNDRASTSELVNGDVDVALSSYLQLFAARNNDSADIKIIAGNSFASARSNVVATAPDSRVKSINDLAGKRIAIAEPGTASHLLTISTMMDRRVAVDKVKWVPTPSTDVAAALASGDVDAAYLTEPYLIQASKRVGAISVADISTGSTQNFPLTGFGTLGKFARSNPRAIAAFQRALAKAVRDTANRSTIERLLVKYSKLDKDTASLAILPEFESMLDARRQQRVPDLLLRTGVIAARFDAAPMLVPQVG